MKTFIQNTLSSPMTTATGGIAGVLVYLVTFGTQLPCLPLVESCSWGDVWRDWAVLVAVVGLIALGARATDPPSEKK